MQVVNEVPKYLIHILGIVPVKNGCYRPFFYTHSVDIDDGMLILNMLTDELILLSNDEKKYFSNTSEIENPVVKELVEKRFLVLKDFDDANFAQEIYNLRNIFSQGFNNDVINQYTILTTTDCNARCYYCYEHGCIKKSMTKQTAVDVADFIIKKSKGQKVKLIWFGGEPLYNVEAINTICKILRENNVNFVSSIISNGYLFNKETIQDDIKKWNLQKVQISLDGLDEDYNRIKAFIYKDGMSAFKRVTDNIELLLSNDIYVSIRVHIGFKNFKNIKNLIDYLIKRYKKYNNCNIYSHMIIDFKSDNLPLNDERRTLHRYVEEISTLLYDSGMTSNDSLKAIDINSAHCMADNDMATTILPDGTLGKCEACIETSTWGSIYNDEIDYDMINSFKQMKNLSDDCVLCKFMPACRHLSKCPIMLRFCGEPEKERILRRSNSLIKQKYKDFLEGNKE